MIRRVPATLWVVAVLLPAAGRAGGPAGIGLDPLVRVLAESGDAGVRRDVLRGMAEALRGRRGVREPAGWPAVSRTLGASPDAEVRELAAALSVLFGDSAALAALRKTAADPAWDPEARRRALEVLLERRPADLLPLLRGLLDDPALRGAALRGLAAYNDPGTPALVLGRYPSLTDAEKADAVGTLASRPAYARALLGAVENGRVPRRDVSPFVARQLAALNDAGLTARLNEVWGAVRPPAGDKAARLTRYRALAPPEALRGADRAHGREVFARSCAACHTLFDDGGKVGPDLTGSQRANPEYILTKVLDPNAAVGRDYQAVLFTTADGRAVTGIVKEENDRAVAVQTATELVRLPKGEIEERQRLGVSLMPEGLLEQLSEAEVRDLLAYLAGPGQVAPPGPAGRSNGAR
jgi:putative heme-binding domain-containing protein